MIDKIRINKVKDMAYTTVLYSRRDMDFVFISIIGDEANRGMNFSPPKKMV